MLGTKITTYCIVLYYECIRPSTCNQTLPLFCPYSTQPSLPLLCGRPKWMGPQYVSGHIHTHCERTIMWWLVCHHLIYYCYGSEGRWLDTMSNLLLSVSDTIFHLWRISLPASCMLSIVQHQQTSKVKYTSISIRIVITTSNALRHGSHSFICKLHHACL